MGKSSDGGITWAEVDAAGSDARNTQDLEGVWVMKDGTSFIMLTTRDDTVTLDEFRMSDHPTNPDTWGLEETVDTGLSTSGVIQATSIVKLSNGNYQCFYSDLLNGTANQIAFKRRTGTNTYTAKTTFNDGAVNVTAPKAVVGENDVTYVFYKDNTADALVYRTVSSTGTVSARTVVASGTAIASDTIPHTNPIYYDDGGVEVIGIAYINDSDILKYRELRDGVLQTEETISSTALTTNPGATDSQSAVAHLAVDVTTVYAMWSRLSDGDLIKRVRTLGSGWGSESTMWASGGGTGWYIYSDVVTEGTDVKLIYTYDWGTHVDDASNTTYNEEVLRQAGGGTTPISGSDSGNLTSTESGAITVSITASDSGNLTSTETVVSVAKSTTTSDTGNITVTETAAVDKSSSTSDTGNITSTETAAVAVSSSTSDTGNITSTETGSIVVALTSSDTGDLTSTEASVSSSTISKADSGDLTVTESAAILSPLTATDSGNLTAVETPNIEVGGTIDKTGSDSGNFTSTENSSVVVQVNGTDSGTLSATEAPSITGTATASDSGNLTVTEGTSSFRTVVASDSGSLTVTEGAVVFNDRPGSDSGTFSATETASIDVLGIVEINASDSGTLSVTESATLAASTTTSDSGNLTSTEATSFVRNITAGDSGSLTATEGATVALTLSANDSGTISSAEAGSVNTDVGGIDMHVWHDGAMVDATFHYWDGTEYRDLDFHLWNGSSFS
jgi:hypothetical protein